MCGLNLYKSCQRLIENIENEVFLICSHWQTIDSV